MQKTERYERVVVHNLARKKSTITCVGLTPKEALINAVITAWHGPHCIHSERHRKYYEGCIKEGERTLAIEDYCVFK